MRTKEESFEELNEMLLREEDWDDEGALALNQLTYERAYCWIENHITNNMISPRVSLGRDGSIDLDWSKNDYCLLLNISNQENLEIHYYGCKWLEKGTPKNEDIIKNVLNDKEIDDRLKKWLNKNLMYDKSK